MSHREGRPSTEAYARPWAAGDPGAVELELVCECGESGCERLVRRRIADYRSPCLAGH